MSGVVVVVVGGVKKRKGKREREREGGIECLEETSFCPSL